MVTAKADDNRRVLLPNIKPGQVFAMAVEGKAITLIPVEKQELEERPYDPHLYDSLPQERIELEKATAKWGGPDPDRE